MRLDLDSENDDHDDDIIMDDDDAYTPPHHSDFPHCTAEAVKEGIKIWLSEFKDALHIPDNYWKHHDNLTDGFQVLSHIANRLDVAKGTIIEHVIPVMKDMYFRGWDQKIHQNGLVTAYKLCRKGMNSVDWAPPAGVPPRGRVRAERLMPPVRGRWLTPLEEAEKVAEKQKKGKAKQVDGPEGKGTKKGAAAVRATPPAPKTPRTSAAAAGDKAPATGRSANRKKSSETIVDSDADDDDDTQLVNSPPCTRCQGDASLLCTVQPALPSKRVGGKPVTIHVCGPCAKSKNKCSLVPPPAGGRRTPKADAKVEDVVSVVSDEGGIGAGESSVKAARAPRARRKPAPTVVPAGGPGELGMSLGSNLVYDYRPSVSSHSSIRRHREVGKAGAAIQRASRGLQDPGAEVHEE
jgi:hypothetical protein